MKLTKNMRVLILFGVAALMLLSYNPPQDSAVQLSSYPASFSIIVKDAATNSPINGAIVQVYYNQLGWKLYSSGTTNSAGVATVTGFYEMDLQIKVSASGYVDNMVTVMFTGSGSQSATVLLAKSGGGGGGDNRVLVNLYCVTAEGYRVQNVHVTGTSLDVVTNADGYAGVLVAPGAVTLSLDASAAEIRPASYWVPKNYGVFPVSITAASGGTWTVYVDSRVAQQMQPPSPGGGGGLMDWLFASLIPGVPNWALVVAAFALLLLARR